MHIIGRCSRCGHLLTEEAPYCPRCGQTVSGRGGATLTVSGGLLERLRDPVERRALGWLVGLGAPGWLLIVTFVIGGMGVPLLFVGMIVLMVLMMELFMAAYIKTNAVEVSERQLPEVYAAARECCEKLGMAVPSVYVMQQSVWNAFAMKAVGRRMVILLSGAIDSVLLKGDMEQLKWVVAHEIGHHFAGHLGFWRRCAEAAFWLPWFVLWYKRRAELTCDRIGLYCCGDLRKSSLALANMTVGAQLAEKVDAAEAIRQWEAHREEFFVRYRTIYSTHPHNLWRFAEMTKAARELGLGPEGVGATS